MTLAELSKFLISQEFICADDGDALAAQRGDRIAGGQFSSQQRGGGHSCWSRGHGHGRSHDYGIRCQICNATVHSTLTCY